MGLRFNANILKVIFDLRISCTDTVKSWYGGHWNSGIPWNSGQNCAIHHLKYHVIVEFSWFCLLWYSKNKTENAVQSQDDEYEWHAKLNDKYTLQDKLDY